MNLNKLGGHICASLGQQKHRPPKDKTRTEVATDIHVHNKKWRARLLVIAEIGQVLGLTEGTIQAGQIIPSCGRMVREVWCTRLPERIGGCTDD